MDLRCDHAGLLLLAPAMTELGLHELIARCGYPATTQLSAWHSIGTLLLAAATRVSRAHHIDKITDDDGLAFFLGLTALPKATHLSTYSYRARRESSQRLLTGLIRRLRTLGLATGEEGFNCDFHAIRHHGDDPVLEEHYVPARSQRTRSVLTFFANDHASNEMVYANADITKTEQAAEVIAFADYWRAATGADPGLLVFDSQLTTYKTLEELSGRSITWLTLRQRGKAELARLAALPASAWKRHTIDRAGRYRHPQLHEDLVTLKGISAPVRQIAIKNIGRDQPTLLITNTHATPARDLFARYAERMLIENELDAYISGFSLNALSSSRAHSTSTWTPPSPSSPATSTASSPASLPALLSRHPRHHLAALPRRLRHPAHHPRRRHRRPHPAQPPPRPHRRRLRRPASAHPLVGRQPAPALPLPAPLTHRARPQSIFCTENRG